MALHNPFTPISKDAPVTRVQRLEARTPDGRYVSHVNDAKVVHLRMRQHPRSQLLRVHKALGAGGVPMTARALLRAGRAGSRVANNDRVKRVASSASRFGNAFLEDRRAQLADAARAGGAARARHGVAGVAGTQLSRLAPASGLVAASTYGAGHHRGKQKALAQTGMAKRYATDTFGKSSADRTVIGHWGKANSNIPDGARRGRRLVAD